MLTEVMCIEYYHGVKEAYTCALHRPESQSSVAILVLTVQNQI